MKAMTKSVLLLAAVAFLAVACSEKKAPADASGDAPVADLGKDIYTGKGACFSCHGDEGHGDGPAGGALKPAPRKFVDDKWKFGTDLATVIHTIENGSKGTSMVGYKDSLSPDEIEAVAKYVLKLGNKEVK